MKKILFTGGGSAGHVVPNLALIEELQANGEAEIFYMGTSGIEKKLVTERNIPFYELECPKLIRGGGVPALLKNLKIPTRFLRAVRQAEKDIAELRPDLVFSKGGYVSLPVVFAAHKLHIPCLAHESDYSAGLANRIAAKKCEKVFTSFPETAKTLRHGEYSGAPMRRALFGISKSSARKKLGISKTAKVLLVFGGGSGSRAINEALRAQLSSISKLCTILHVCGKNGIIESGVKNYLQYEFIADMATAYAGADLVLARAGSGTVFEVLALKKPTIFVPLEGATRGDQLQNAEYFEKKGLCRVLRQKDLSEKLSQTVADTLNDRALAANLQKQTFTCGNDKLLSEIRAFLSP